MQTADADAGTSPGRIRHVVARTALVTAAAGLGMTLGGMPKEFLFTALGFVGYTTAGLAVAAESRRVGLPMPPINDLPLTAVRARQLAVVAASTLVVSLAALYLSLILLSLPFGDWVTTSFLQPDADELMPTGMVHRALFAIETVALAPLVEELVFRGVMLHWWSRTLGLRRAVITSAVIFGAMHFDPLGSTLFALVASALYMSTGTMLAPIVFHAMWNCLVTILTAVSEGAASEVETLAAFRGSWPVAVVALLAAGLVLSRAVRSLRPPDGWQLPPLR